MVGLFFYISSKTLKFKGLLCHIVPLENAELYGDFLMSGYGHDKLFDKKFPNKIIEYSDYPRGRITYNTKTKEHIIYIDRCIEIKAPEVAKLFEILSYRIAYDDHYVCKKCVNKFSSI